MFVSKPESYCLGLVLVLLLSVLMVFVLMLLCWSWSWDPMSWSWSWGYLISHGLDIYCLAPVTGKYATKYFANNMKTRDLHGDGDHGNPAESAGIPRGWKLMLRGSRGGGGRHVAGLPRGWKNLYGILAKCSCIRFFVFLGAYAPS